MRRCLSVWIWLATVAAVSVQPADADDNSGSPAERALLRPDREAQPAEPPETAHSLIDDARIPHADFESCECAPPAQCDVYQRRQCSVSYLTGLSWINLGPAPVPFTVLPEIVRFNRVFNDPRPDRLLKGSFEWIFELDTLPVVNGPASIVIGAAAMLRYNFGTYKHKRLVPYGQIGGGGIYTDAFLYRRGILSTGFEFIIHAGGGCNYFLTDRLALTLEWSYFHLSNSGIVLPNIGVNEVGGLVGLTYFFRRHRCH